MSRTAWTYQHTVKSSQHQSNAGMTQQRQVVTKWLHLFFVYMLQPAHTHLICGPELVSIPLPIQVVKQMKCNMYCTFNTKNLCLMFTQVFNRGLKTDQSLCCWKAGDWGLDSTQFSAFAKYCTRCFSVLGYTEFSKIACSSKILVLELDYWKKCTSLAWEIEVRD